MYFSRLEDLRIDADKTQQQIADVLNCKREVYRRYEKGIYEIPVWALIRLAEYYQVSTDYILGLSDEKEQKKKKKGVSMSWDSPFLLLRAAKGTENGYLRASVLRRGTFGAKVPKTWGPFPWSPNPHRRPKGKIFPLETFSPVRCGLGESETTT